MLTTVRSREGGDGKDLCSYKSYGLWNRQRSGDGGEQRRKILQNLGTDDLATRQRNLLVQQCLLSQELLE